MNITLSVEDEIVQAARELARSRGTSLNQLVRDYLEGLVRPRDADEFRAELRSLTKQGKGRSRGWRFNREELHERR